MPSQVCANGNTASKETPVSSDEPAAREEQNRVGCIKRFIHFWTCRKRGEWAILQLPQDGRT